VTSELWNSYPPGSQRPPARSTLAIMFLLLDTDPSEYERYTEAYTSNVLGGPIRFSLKNFGPAGVSDVSIDLVSESLQAESILYWEKIEVNEEVEFEVRIPFNAARNVLVRWGQAEWSFDRATELPVGTVGGQQ
jgi:hypothetical protein